MKNWSNTVVVLLNEERFCVGEKENEIDVRPIDLQFLSGSVRTNEPE